MLPPPCLHPGVSLLPPVAHPHSMPCLPLYMAYILPSSTAKISDALNNMRYVHASPINSTLPPTPHSLAYLSILFNISHDGGPLTRHWAPPSACARFIPSFTAFIWKWSSDSDLPIHCSWKKLPATNLPATVVFGFPQALPRARMPMHLTISFSLPTSPTAAKLRGKFL